MAELTIDQIRKLILYFPETGIFHWRERTPSILSSMGASYSRYKQWNARYLHVLAIGSVRTDGYLAVRILGHQAAACSAAIVNRPTIPSAVRPFAF